MKIEFKKCCGEDGNKMKDKELAGKMYDSIMCNICPNSVVVAAGEQDYKLANAWNCIANGEKR